MKAANIIVGFAIALLIFGVISLSLSVFFVNLPDFSYSDFNDIFSPIFALMSGVLVLHTIRTQIEANKLAMEQFGSQSDDARMFRLLDEISKSIDNFIVYENRNRGDAERKLTGVEAINRTLYYISKYYGFKGDGDTEKAMNHILFVHINEYLQIKNILELMVVLLEMCESEKSDSKKNSAELVKKMTRLVFTTKILVPINDPRRNFISHFCDVEVSGRADKYPPEIVTLFEKICTKLDIKFNTSNENSFSVRG